MKLRTQVGHIVTDGDPATPPPKRHSPQFSAHICCGQLAAWIKMPLGTDVGLRPGHFVRWGPTPSPKRGRSRPIFGPCLLRQNARYRVRESLFYLFFTARRNARIASAVLATATPSVCPSVRLSVTRQYCVKTTAHSTVQFALSNSKMCLVL